MVMEPVEYYVLICDDNISYLDRMRSAINRVNEDHRDFRIVPKMALSEEHFIEYIKDSVFDFVILDTCLSGNRVLDDTVSEYQWLRSSLMQAQHGAELYKYVQKYCPSAFVMVVSNLPVERIKDEFHTSGIYGLKLFNKKQTDENTLANYIANHIVTKGKRLVNNVFVVYGHNLTMRADVERYLKRFGINIIGLDRNAPGGMHTVFSKLNTSAEKADCAVVLMSGDDRSFDDEQMPSRRARQNVVFEAGLFLGKLGQDRVIVLEEPCDNFEWPSDLRGLHSIPYGPDGAWKEALRRQLQEIGFSLFQQRSRG